MSYRKARQSDCDRESLRWLQEHREDLNALGLPKHVYDTMEEWDSFLSSGAVDHPYSFVFYEDLSDEQQLRLLLFLERELPSRTSVPPLLAFLRTRFPVP